MLPAYTQSDNGGLLDVRLYIMNKHFFYSEQQIEFMSRVGNPPKLYVEIAGLWIRYTRSSAVKTKMRPDDVYIGETDELNIRFNISVEYKEQFAINNETELGTHMDPMNWVKEFLKQMVRQPK